ncbi:MAG: hypothetical protein LBR24_02540 [Methanobrevibacter sp.]|jgi:hypothetical protein|nr:hypothetical protein [Methanobrevibacter sp.]
MTVFLNLIEKTDIDVKKASNDEIVNKFIIEKLDDWDDEEITSEELAELEKIDAEMDKGHYTKLTLMN